VDELITSRASSAADADLASRNREVVGGHESSVSPLPEGPVPIGSLVFADELPDGVVMADEVGRIVVFNRVAARLTGLDPSEVIGKFVFDVLPLRDADGSDWWLCADPYHGLPTRTRHPERSLYLSDGTEVLVSVGYVREGRPARGARKPVAAGKSTAGKSTAAKSTAGEQASPGQPGAGAKPGYAGQPGSVRRLVISLRGAQQRERLERSRAELVSTVAHELRSPLTSVKGFTATLLNKWSRFTDDQKRVMLETVNADADRVTRLITELLDVSRIESGRMEVHRELVDLADRARKIIAGRVASGDAEDRFRLEVRSGVPETWLDADKIDQILGNLVENAVRHGAGIVTIVVEPAHLDDLSKLASTPQLAGPGRLGSATRTGSAPCTANVAASTSRENSTTRENSAAATQLGAPDAASVSVRDQGEGIAPDVAPRVFRQFWRGKRRGGTGLGLYIVKGLVEAHGGAIGVCRAPGGGAEFRFIVPAGTAAA
jgi:PAS domain S-box-containing protein